MVFTIDKWKIYDYHTHIGVNHYMDITTAAKRLSSDAARRVARSMPWNLLLKLYSKIPTKPAAAHAGVQHREKGAIHLLKLKEIRLREGLTQVQLAERLGVPQTTLSNWENGVNPDCEMICRIAAELHCTTDELLGVEKGA